MNMAENNAKYTYNYQQECVLIKYDQKNTVLDGQFWKSRPIMRSITHYAQIFLPPEQNSKCDFFAYGSISWVTRIQNVFNVIS